MNLRLDQIQTLFFTGYGGLPEARILLLEAGPPQAAKTALGRIQPKINFGKTRAHRAVQLAFTFRGLQRLKLPHEALSQFPLAFREPAESEYQRRTLGDEAENAPEHWHWSGDRTDAALMIYAADATELQALESELTANMADGFRVIHRIETQTLEGHKEHFGFRDGISQPKVRELKPHAPPEEAVAMGELVLGYQDESGEVPPTPTSGDLDLGLDGTYLVLRQLAQDVPGFWKAARERAADDAEAVWLAAKMMGLWPNGAPIRAAHGKTMPENETGLPPRYRDDRFGDGCPRGAHVRRANPRDALHSDPLTAIQKVRRHRILRRGRTYGPPAPAEVFPNGVSVTAAHTPPGKAEDERGLIFICLCANLSRQFELVQQTWLNNAKHDGLFDEVCPIAAGRALHADQRRFTIPQKPLRQRIHGWPNTITVKGSAYLFLPGKHVLARLASHIPHEPAN